MQEKIHVSDEIIQNKIYLIRRQKIMLDKDLAEMYGVTTGNLNKAVKRNIKRFPEDFMFQLEKEEYNNLIFQIGISKDNNKIHGGTRKMPYAFTEQGVAMLSGVLNSDRAINVNIKIFRIFSKMHQMIMNHQETMVKLIKIEKQILKIDRRTELNEKDIFDIFDVLNQLIAKDQKPLPPRSKIGYKK